jgi:uridine kinase
LDEEGSRKAFRNEYDFDSPDAIDFDALVDRLRDLKAGYVDLKRLGKQNCASAVANEPHRKRAEIPVYSFAKHARQKETTSIYSPHVLILEGIFALYDPRVLELLDMKVCLSGPRTPRINYNFFPDLLRGGCRHLLVKEK